MLTRDQASAIFDKLRKILLCGRGRIADFKRTKLPSHDSRTTRSIKMLREENHALSLRVSMDVGSANGGRTARASTNKLDDNSLHRLAKTAETLVRMQQPDPELLPMPTPREVSEAEVDGDGVVQRHLERTARIDAQDRAAAVARIVDGSEERQAHIGRDLRDLGVRRRDCSIPAA